MGIRWYSVVLFCCCVLGLALLSLPRGRERGMLLNRGGRIHEAEPLLLESLVLNPNDRTVILELLDLYRRSGTVEKALPILSRYQATHPRDQGIRVATVQAFLQLYRFDEGIALLEGHADRIEDQDLLLLLYERAGYLKKAVAMCRRQLQDDEDDYVIWERIARLQQWRFDVSGHAEALEAMFRIRGRAEDGLVLLELYLWKERRSEARRTAETLSVVKALPLRALQVLRSFYLQERELAAATLVGERVCRHAEAEAQDFLDLAAFRVWQEERRPALSAVLAGLKRFPTHLDLLRQGAFHAHALEERSLTADLQLRLARLTKRERDWIRAAMAQGEAGSPQTGREILKEQLRGEGGAVAVVIALGRLALMADDRKEAQRLAERAAERLQREEKLNPELLLATAELFRAVGFDAAEVEQLERFEKVETSPDVLLNLAAAYNRMGEFDKGLKALARSMKLPGVDKVRLRRERAWLLLAKLEAEGTGVQGGLRAKVIGAIEEALEDGFERELAQGLVEQYGAAGRLKEAATLMAKMPNASAGVRLNLVGAFLKAGRKGEAIRLLEQLGRPGDLPLGELSHLAYLHRELGNHGLAIKLLTEADRRSQGDREIRRALADAYGAAGNVHRQYEIVDALARDGEEPDWLAAADRRQWNEDRRAEAELLATAQRFFPESIPILARRITAHVALGEMEKALALRKDVLEVADQAPADTLYIVAEMLVGVKEFDEAVVLFRRILKALPTHRDARLGLARALAQGTR
ncbi:MAG: tetratricopeptide repeat protein, partial [Planctomycetota bacterium]